jgi:hypothetical protein
MGDEDTLLEVRLLRGSTRVVFPGAEFLHGTPVRLPSQRSSTRDLTELLRGLLAAAETAEPADKLLFDFAVDGRRIPPGVTLPEFLREIGFASGASGQQGQAPQHFGEDTVDVQFFLRAPAPQLGNSLETDDWIASLCALGQHTLAGSYDGRARIFSPSLEGGLCACADVLRNFQVC